jgi:hypothetical protein
MRHQDADSCLDEAEMLITETLSAILTEACAEAEGKWYRESFSVPFWFSLTARAFFAGEDAGRPSAP